MKPSAEALYAEATIVAMTLSKSRDDTARQLAKEICVTASPAQQQAAGATAGPLALSVLVVEGRRLLHDAEDVRLERAAESQRRVMWLTCVGLLLVLALGVTGLRMAMLLGALGGFLAPLTKVWQKDSAEVSGAAVRNDESTVARHIGEAEYVTSWGTLVVGPVAGALAAFGGLLLLTFLADEKLNVLGEVFRVQSWNRPSTPFALGLALLLGFSGGLFGRIALKASGQILPPTSTGAAQQAESVAGPGQQTETSAAERPVGAAPLTSGVAVPAINGSEVAGSVAGAGQRRQKRKPRRSVIAPDEASTPTRPASDQGDLHMTTRVARLISEAGPALAFLERALEAHGQMAPNGSPPDGLQALETKDSQTAVQAEPSSTADGGVHDAENATTRDEQVAVHLDPPTSDLTPAEGDDGRVERQTDRGGARAEANKPGAERC